MFVFLFAFIFHVLFVLFVFVGIPLFCVGLLIWFLRPKPQPNIIHHYHQGPPAPPTST